MAYRLSWNRLWRLRNLRSLPKSVATPTSQGSIPNVTCVLQLGEPCRLHTSSQVYHKALRQTDLQTHASDKKEVVSVSPDSTGITDLHAPTEVEMSSADLLWVWMKSVFEIPARLDMDKLYAALSKTLAVYRPVCGRIRKNSANDWKILLTNSPMPVEIVECTNPPQLDTYVCQPHEAVSPLVPHMTAPYEVINNNLPLASLKVTLSAEKTMLGISWHHALGDGVTRLRFMSLLSRYYQDLEPLHPLPSFARHHFFLPASENAKLQDDLAYFRGLGGTSDLETGPKPPVTVSNNTVLPNLSVHWIVPRTKANILRQNMQQSTGTKVSTQDCLTAYVASAVHQCGYDIRRINYTVAFRGVSPECNDLNLAGNLSATACLGELEDTDACDPCRVALKMRQGISALRTPEGFEKIMRQCEQFLHRGTKKRDWRAIYRCAVIPNTLKANSMASITWQKSVNFGYPGAKYYASQLLDIPFYLRIYAANPIAGQSVADALDVSLAVPESLHSEILKKLELSFN